MKKGKILSLLACTLFAMSLGITSCSEDDDPTPQDEYIGSTECMSCHETIYNTFIESGHPYKLNEVIGDAQPVIPFRTSLSATIPTPAGYTWGDITYMIGGYGWKARFIDSEGYIITKNADTQYNLADGSQVTYHGDDEIGTKKYDCGKCHTTGWQSVADGASPKDGLPGMDGDFFAGGVHCEECHGKGGLHADSRLASDITLDNSDALCGRCHTRNADNSIAASGGFIKHHEQYDEWLTSGHNAASVGCMDCHDPHASVKYDSQAQGNGVTAGCTSCHASITIPSPHSSISCETCHMPKASKSALKTGDYMGDISTHIFTINPSATGTLFNTAGDLANPDGLGVSLDYVCYQCHDDEQGLGGGGSVRTMTELSAEATNYHD